MSAIADHPLRYALTNELHARPFPVMGCPGQVAFIAIKPDKAPSIRDRERDRAHLIALLDRHGVAHPPPDATHYSGQIGRFTLKWESHTEFVTFTAFAEGAGERAFDPAVWDVFPSDWLAAAPGSRITSAHIRIGPIPGDEAEIDRQLADWFVPESLAVSRVLDDTALVAGDFRIAATGHMQFAVFAAEGTGRQRIGRIVQRICEIETYKTMAMLGLPRAREIGAALGPSEQRLERLTGDMAGDIARPEEALAELLATAAELENALARAAYRFAASRAYEAIVNQRVAVLREERFQGRQTLAEFMMRRFDPAMRTVAATERRIQSMIDRATRAGDLLRTRVDVDRSAQNQALLESMDRRADLQLRLQKTVEGLSVVAISYYAVSLAAYLAAPFAERAGVSKTEVTAALVVPVVAVVWLVIRRIRKAMH
ncbi:DUF3422 family protein [Rhodobacterales bacterium HKCCE2091]|nr:DUF3422 family protein [Rhodobacterales bacterium HKCCE2091]